MFLGTLGMLLASTALFAGGATMVYMGYDARNDVQAQLAAEKITTSKDAAIPNAFVDSAEEALAQADVIQKHTLERTEHKTYADMAKEDPNREFYLKAVTLRTALSLSYMGFKVADLVMGVGALFMLAGAGLILHMAGNAARRKLNA